MCIARAKRGIFPDSLLPSLIGFLLALALCNAGLSSDTALQNLSERGLATTFEVDDERAGGLLRQKEHPGRFMCNPQLFIVLPGFLVGDVCLLPLTVLLAKAAFRSGLPAA